MFAFLITLSVHIQQVNIFNPFSCFICLVFKSVIGELSRVIRILLLVYRFTSLKFLYETNIVSFIIYRSLYKFSVFSLRVMHAEVVGKIGIIQRLLFNIY